MRRAREVPGRDSRLASPRASGGYCTSTGRKRALPRARGPGRAAPQELDPRVDHDVRRRRRVARDPAGRREPRSTARASPATASQSASSAACDLWRRVAPTASTTEARCGSPSHWNSPIARRITPPSSAEPPRSGRCGYWRSRRSGNRDRLDDHVVVVAQHRHATARRLAPRRRRPLLPGRAIDRLGFPGECPVVRAGRHAPAAGTGARPRAFDDRS